jgi:hypothetical protein
MFELRCSEFELGCSESAGQPPTYQTSCAPWRPTEHENWIQREKGHPVGPTCDLPQSANQRFKNMRVFRSDEGRY